MEEQLAFWRGKLNGLKFDCPVDSSGGPNDIASQCEYEAKYRATPEAGAFPRLTVALYRQLAEWTGNRKPVVTFRLHRRDPGRYDDVAGWFAGDAPLPLDIGRDGTERLQSELRSLPMGGVTYEILSNRGDLPEAHEISPVRLNYQPLGFSENGSGGSFRLYESQNHDRLYLLDIIVREKEGFFQVIVRYSKNRHTRDTVIEFVRRWLSKVQASVKTVRQEIRSDK